MSFEIDGGQPGERMSDDEDGEGLCESFHDPHGVTHKEGGLAERRRLRNSTLYQKIVLASPLLRESGEVSRPSGTGCLEHRHVYYRFPDENSVEKITHWISNGSGKGPKRGKPRVYSRQK